ncbi:hypothetical protein K4K52_012666 [Colletotrichum sp. SAR 10_76]|nr:hypothetical protein K4K52_012666 [Colletotrichum sp. SAR 10_76]
MQGKSSNNKDQQESAKGPDGASETRRRSMRHKRGPKTTQKEAKTGRDLAQIKSDISDLAARRPENFTSAAMSAEPASRASSPSRHAAPFTIKKSATIRNLRTKISDALDDADANQEAFIELYNELHQKWWEEARKLNNMGGHHGLRGHVLDWPVFFRDLSSQQHTEDLLHIVFQKEWAAATRKHSPKLVNAQKALGLTSTIELVLEIGPDAITNTKAVAGISSLRVPTNHEAVPAATIRAKILDVVLAGWRDGDPAPVPTTDNITNAVNALKAAARPKAAAIQKRTRKRRPQTAEPEDDEDEPEEPRAKRRRTTIDLDIEESMGDNYVASILNNGEATMLTTVLHSEGSMSMSLCNDETMAINESRRFSELFDESMNDELDDETRSGRTGELLEMLREQDEMDSLVREQVELSLRIQKKGAAKVEAGDGGTVMNAAFSVLAGSAAMVVETAKRDGLLAYLEKRKQERAKYGYPPGDEEPEDDQQPEDGQ